MGIKSTCSLTRELAKQIIVRHLSNASDKAILGMLEQLPQSHYRNYEIRGDWQLTDINSLEDFETI